MNVRRHRASAAHRLHNSLVALAAAAVVSAAGLLAGHPLPAPVPEAALAVAVMPAGALVLDAGIDAGVDAGTDQAQAEPEADLAPRKSSKHPRRSRQSLAIPYFSFARS